MRIAENLIKNRGLINTFNRFKTKLYLNKFYSKNKKCRFYFLKYRYPIKNNIIYSITKIIVPKSNVIFCEIKVNTFFKKIPPFFKNTIMFL